MKVILYTDEPTAATGFIATLEHVPDIEASWADAEPAGLAHEIAIEAPDLLLLDWATFNSLEVLADVRHANPQLRIVLWVRDLSVELASAALALGVRGILPKTLKQEQMLHCLRTVGGNEIWLQNKLTSELLEAKQVKLSSRESEMVMMLSRGLKSKEIADEMGLTEATVKTYLSRLFQKTGTKDRLELALFGLKNAGSDMTGAIFRRPRVQVPFVRKSADMPGGYASERLAG